MDVDLDDEFNADVDFEQYPITNAQTPKIYTKRSYDVECLSSIRNNFQVN